MSLLAVTIEPDGNFEQFSKLTPIF